MNSNAEDRLLTVVIDDALERVDCGVCAEFVVWCTGVSCLDEESRDEVRSKASRGVDEVEWRYTGRRSDGERVGSVQQ